MSTYSSNLKIELIATGDQSGVWGTTTNSNFSNVFEQSIVGRVTVSFSNADVTLTATNTVASQDYRNVYLNCTGTNAASRNLIVPTLNKNYIVENNTTGGFSIVVKTSAGTGITIPNGSKCAVYVDGTNVVQNDNYFPAAVFASITDSGLTSGRVTFASTSGLLADSANLTWDGSFLTAASIKDTALTSGRVTFAGASGLLSDSANLTWDGSTFGVTGAGTFSTGLTRTHAQGTDAYITNTTTGKANTVVGFNDSGSTNAQGVPTGYAYYGTLQTFPVAITTSGILAATFSTSGNLGLGVTPSAWDTTVYKASQIGTGIGVGSVVGRTDGANGAGLALNGYYSTTGWRYIGTSNASLYFQSSGQHQWYNAPSGTAGNLITLTQAMTLDASGNLGIGPTSPSVKLHASTSGAGIQEVEWLNNSQAVGADVGSAMVFTGTSSNNGLARISGAFAGATTADGAYMAFSTRAVTTGALTERMRLDASGILGLGVTPSAWGSNYKVMEFGDSDNQSFFYGQTNANVVSMGTNTYHDGTNYKYKFNGYASFYLQFNGEHRWAIAPSGTAGNTASFTQAMTLDAIGNLGIGTSSPQGSFKLTISGTDTISPAVYLENTTNSKAYSMRATGTSWIIRDNTVGEDRITLNTSGNVGIGTSSPSSKLDVESSAAQTLVRITSTDSGGRIWNMGSLATASGLGTGGSFAFRDSTQGNTQVQIGQYNQTVSLQGASPVSGTGITFPATQSASSNANTLDDYEEGTWTPNLTRASVSPVISTTVSGGYTKVGNVITIWGIITINSITSQGTNVWLVSGIPFNFTGTRGSMGAAGNFSVTSISTAQNITAVGDSNAADNYFYLQNADGSAFTTNVQAGTLYLTLTYQTS